MSETNVVERQPLQDTVDVAHEFIEAELEAGRNFRFMYIPLAPQRVLALMWRCDDQGHLIPESEHSDSVVDFVGAIAFLHDRDYTPEFTSGVADWICKFKDAQHSVHKLDND